MPIISKFPSGGGSGGGIALPAVTGISSLSSSGKIYIKWTDPENLVLDGITVAEWSGTLLVRKAGSYPNSRKDGTIVLDSKVRNSYSSNYFCDSGLSNGVTYYYKFFPYTTNRVYTDSDACKFTATPSPVNVGNVSNITATANGNGKLAVKWTDPAATVVTDGVTLATWASTKVVYKTGSYPTSPSDGTLAINSTTRNAYSSTAFNITGLTNGTTYYIAFFPISSDGAVNTNTANRKTGVPNLLKITTVPSQTGSLTYNGEFQSPVWNNYDSTTLKIGGQQGATNAGTYTVSFTPKTDYCWSDGTTSAKLIDWTIGKAAGSLSITPTSLTLDTAHLSGTITANYPGDGILTATSNNTSVATVSVSDKTITVNHVNKTSGTATITVNVAAGTNHTAPSSKTCAVSCEFISKTLENNEWSVIRSVADAGQAANYWSIGDRKGVYLSGTAGSLSLNKTYYCYIIGFDHNSAKEGSNCIHFQFGFTTASGGVNVCFVDSGFNVSKTTGSWFNMNNSNSNSGGWESSRMRNTIIPTFKACLPTALQNVLKTVTKYSDNTGDSSNAAGDVTSTQDDIFLLSECEVHSSTSYSNDNEWKYQSQYSYYSAGNSKMKYKHNDTSTSADVWLRSANKNNSRQFCIVGMTGDKNYRDASYSYGFAPAFCV